MPDVDIVSFDPVTHRAMVPMSDYGAACQEIDHLRDRITDLQGQLFAAQVAARLARERLAWQMLPWWRRIARRPTFQDTDTWFG